MTSETTIHNNPYTIIRLTALWGLCESGLGGAMHLLKFPLTGLFVGGFAMIIISMIAMQHKHSFRILLQATLMVLLIKFTVSPQSPLPAYIAVSFQGLMGAILFSILPFRLAALLLLILGMAESAYQGIFVPTIIYGKSFWVALDSFFEKLSGSFGLSIPKFFSGYFVTSYLLLYVIFGVIIGLWIGKLPHIIAKKKDSILHYCQTKEETQATNTRKRIPRWIVNISILVFISVIYWVNGQGDDILWILIRTFIIIAFVFLVIEPLLIWVLYRLKNTNSISRKLNAILVELPDMRDNVSTAMSYSRTINGIGRYTAFIIAMLVLTIYGER